MQRLTIPVLSPKVYLFVQSLCILGIVARSVAQPLPPPIPTPREESQPIQHETPSKEQQPPERDNPPQDTMPSNTVNILQGPQTTEPRRNQSNQSSQPTSDQGINWPVWLTAMFTGALVLAGFLQLLAIWRQAR